MDWIEQGSDGVDKILGHIGERNDEGEWERFDFEIIDHDGGRHTVSISEDDLGENDWAELFDWLEDWAEEYDIDYENKYGET